MKRIYLSGPITGYPNGNREMFRLYKEKLSGLGWRVLVPHDIPPHEHSGACPPSWAEGEGHSSACYLRGDLRVMLQADAVLMLAGWDRSVGARLEHSVSASCGLLIFYSASEVPELRNP